MLRFLKKINKYKSTNVEFINTIYHDLHLEKKIKIEEFVTKFIRKYLNRSNYKSCSDDNFKNIPKRFQTHEMTLNKYLR